MQQYTIQSHTGPVTVLLSDEDAAARGLTKAKAAPKAKPEPEDEPELEPEVEAKAAAPANKSRRASNKRAAAVEAAFNAK
jgi:hypothetical protein